MPADKTKKPFFRLVDRLLLSCLILLVILPSFTAPALAENLTSTSASPSPIDWNIKFKAGASLNSLFFVNDSLGWAVGENGLILYTDDGGGNWHLQQSGVAADLYSVFFLNQNYGWACGDNGTIIYTFNGGQTWLPGKVESRICLRDIWFISEKEGWAVGENLILHSSDGGLTWTAQYRLLQGHLFALYFSSGQKGWAVGGPDLLLCTTDGGATWHKQEVEERYYFYRDIVFLDSTHGWAVGSKGALVSTTDGGMTWHLVESHTSSSLNSIGFSSPQEGWIAGEWGTLLHTTDAGATWLVQETDYLDHLMCIMPTSKEVWAVGSEGHILTRTREPTYASIQGKVLLQGRKDYSGVIVTAGDNFTISGSDGSFRLSGLPPGIVSLSLRLPGYRSASKEVFCIPGATTFLPPVTLQGGDVNSDGKVNFADLSLVVSHFNSDSKVGDVNGDGRVDIFDLVLVGLNFGSRGDNPWDDGLWTGGDISGGRIVLQDFIIPKPIAIKDAVVGLAGISFPKELIMVHPDITMLTARNSILYLYYPVPRVKEFPSIPRLIQAEKCTIIIPYPHHPDIPSCYGDAGYYLSPFNRIVDCRIVYASAVEQGGFATPTAEGGFSGNKVEFRHGGPGNIESQGEFVLKDCGWDREYELQAGGPSLRVIGAHLSLGDVRLFDGVQVELYDSTSHDSIYLTGNSQLTATRCTHIGPMVLGESELYLKDSQGNYIIAGDEAKVYLYNSDPGPGISAGGNAKIYLMGGTLDYNARGTFVDQAHLYAEQAKIRDGSTLYLLGNSVVELTECDMSGGRIELYDQASLILRDSIVGEIFIFDEASLRLENAVVRHLYYEVRVYGTAIINTGAEPQFSGEASCPHISLDASSQVMDYTVGGVVVNEGGNLTIIASELLSPAPVLIYGDATIINSTLSNLMVYGRDSVVKLQNSHVFIQYYSLHCEGKGNIDETSITGDVILVESQADESSQVELNRLGLIHAGGNAHLSCHNIWAESIEISDKATAQLEDIVVRSIKISDSASAALQNVSFHTVEFNPPLPFNKVEAVKFGYPFFVFSPDAPAEVEISGQAQVTAWNSEGRFKVSGDARLTLDRVYSLIAYGQSKVDMRKGWNTFCYVFEEAIVFAINSRIGGTTAFILDNALLIDQSSWSQDLMFGRRKSEVANGMVVGIYREKDQDPLSAREMEEECLSGTVYIQVWGPVSDKRRNIYYLDHVGSRTWDKLEIYVNGHLLPKEDNSGLFSWNTKEFPNGLNHMVIKATRNGVTISREFDLRVCNQ